jgi:hypothetical protein
LLEEKNYNQIMDKPLIQDLKNSWRNVNSASTGFLQSIPTDKIATKPFEHRFTTFSWEFACIIRTRLCYLDALKTGIFNFTDREEIPNKEIVMEESKATMLKELSETSGLLLKEIEKIDSQEKVAAILWLLQHERIHHGKLMIYHSQAGYKLPASFVKTWGEDNFK